MKKGKVSIEFINKVQEHRLGTAVVYEHVDQVIHVHGVESSLVGVDGNHIGFLNKVWVENGMINFEGKLKNTPENLRDIGLARYIDAFTKVKPPNGTVVERIVMGEGLYYDMAGRWAGLAEFKAAVCKKLKGYKRLLGEYRGNRVRLVAEVLSNG